MTAITHTTTGATGIGTATGLPTGVTAAWAANTITISGTPTASGTFNYSIPLTGGCGLVNATGTIGVSTAPPIATVTNGARCGAGTVGLSASGTGTIKWYNASTGGTLLSSGNSYTTPSISTTTIYYAMDSIVATGCISPTRTAVTATVNTVPSAPSVTNGARCGTGTVGLSASGTGTIKWYNASTDGTLLSSGNSYTTPSISSTTTYYAMDSIVATGCISAIRTAVTATVNAPPYIISQPVSPTKICSGNGVQILSVNAGGGNLNYLWRKNGTSVVDDNVVSGQGTSSLTFTNTTSAYVDNYDVLIYSSCFPSVTSNSVFVGLNSNLLPSVYVVSSAMNRVICSGERVTFIANPVNGGSTPQYQWRINGLPVIGANSSTFITSNLNNNDAVSVQMTSSLVVCSGSSTVQSNALFMTVNNSPRFVRNFASGCINRVVPIYLVTDTLPAVINPWISLDTLIATVENATPNANVIGRDTGMTSIIYTDINGCKDTLTYKVTSLLNSPDTIHGDQVICRYYNNTGYTDTIHYYVDNVAGASSYDWIMPRGAQIVSGWGTNSIGIVIDTTIYARYGGGWIYLGALNEDGCSSHYIGLRLYRNAIPAGPITGPNQICDFVGRDTLIHYHIDSLPSVRTYLWSVPIGATLVSGQGTNDIYVLFSDTIKSRTSLILKIIFNCATSTNKFLYLYRSNPPIPTIIYGSDSVCNVGNGAIYTYYVDSIPGIDNYEWVFPSTVSILSGQGTSTVNVEFSSTYNSSKIEVRAVSQCGYSLFQNLNVKTTRYKSTSGIYGPSNVCYYMNSGKPAIYSIKKVVGVPYYIWEYPVVGTDSIIHPAGSGENDTLIMVYYNASLNLNLEDSIRVRSGGCNYNTPSILLLKGAVPSTPYRIIGPSNVCGYIASNNIPNGRLVTYTISKVRNALSYVWAISGNATIIDHPAGFGENDTIIRVKFNTDFSSGTIYVNAANTCGFGSPKTMLISISKVSSYFQIFDTTLSTCPMRIIEYSVTSFPSYADSIIWTVPSVARIISGQGTTTIRVEYPSNVNLSSLVSATSMNNCSVGSTRYFRVSFNAVSCPGTIPPVVPTAKDIPYSSSEFKEMKSLSDLNVKIYPNPSSDNFNINVTSSIAEKISVIIYNLQGKEIKRILVSAGGELNKIGAELKSGVYFIRFIQKGMSKTEKVIKL